MEDKSLYIQPMNIKDYFEIYEMWSNIPGIELSEADSEGSIARYIERNPNLSYIYYKDNRIVGTILCGHDGRRGFIHHTCVLPEYRGQSIGKILVEKSLEELRNCGIEKCHIFVFHDNEVGHEFWSKMGWEKRSDVLLCSKDV